MKQPIDWLDLWRELVETRTWHGHDEKSKTDHWRARAQEFDANVKQRWARADSSRTWVLDLLAAHPGATVLDIGAGTGKWAILLARHARQVTALEPSPAMREFLRANLAAEQVANVAIVPGAWPHVEVAPHDFALCSHAMYGSPDFATFIQRMQAVTRHTCILLMRAPTPDGIMAEASRHIYGHPYDSANFQVGVNALWQMGIFPHVHMEDTGLWRPWVSASLADALADLKRKLGVSDTAAYDDFLRALLHRRLTFTDGQYVWPPGVRTALLFWRVPATDHASATATLHADRL